MTSFDVAVIGSGSYGTALAQSWAEQGKKVLMWARSVEVVSEINVLHLNSRYTGLKKLSANISATTDLEEACRSSRWLIYSCPSQILPTVFEQIARVIPRANPEAVLVNTAKGLDLLNLQFHDDIAKSIFGVDFANKHYLTWSGPSFAKEIIEAHPTCVSLSGRSPATLERARKDLSHDRLRIYTNNDPIGTQLGGAMKNVIAIAVGLTQGLGFGANSQAAVTTLGMHEMIQLGEALGGKRDTLWGFSGLGDTILTCGGLLSRNRQLGVALGEGLSIADAKKKIHSTVEGIPAAEAIWKISQGKNLQNKKLSLPVCHQVYKILFEGMNAKDAMTELLNRPTRPELGEEPVV